MMQLFFSCAEEKEFVNDRNLKEINLKRQPFEEVLKSPIFNTAFQKVVNRKINFTQSEVARTALEDAHGFTIVEDYPVNILNYDNYTTYSLLIKSDGEKKIGFENLLIRVDSLNRTVATIINYKTSQEDFSNLAPSFFQTVEKEVKPLIENDAVVQPEDADKITTEHCLNYLIPMCTIHGGNIDYDHVFINSNSCIVSYYTLQEICFTTTVFGGAGGNETSSGNSSPGGNTGGNTGGGSTNNNNGLGASGGAIPNAPVLPCGNCIEEEEEVTANPCDKINKLHTDYPNLKNALINLAATKTQSHENGIYIDSNPTTPSIQNLTFGSAAQGASINLPSPSGTIKYKMVAHTHDATGPTGTGTFSIFSWNDLTRIAELITENHIDTALVFYCITADNTQYALTIDSPLSFAEYFDIKTPPNGASIPNYFNGEKAIKLFYESELYYSDEPKPDRITLTSNPEDDKLIFMKMIKKLKLAVSLLEVDSNFENHSKLSLNNGVVITTPCN